jgi:hypothetical protein
MIGGSIYLSIPVCERQPSSPRRRRDRSQVFPFACIPVARAGPRGSCTKAGEPGMFELLPTITKLLKLGDADCCCDGIGLSGFVRCPHRNRIRFGAGKIGKYVGAFRDVCGLRECHGLDYLPA